MMHPHDPANEPTAAQEAMYQMQCEIDAIKAQLREAVECLDYLFVSTSNDWVQSKADNDVHDRIVNCLAQHADIVKELEQAKRQAMTNEAKIDNGGPAFPVHPDLIRNEHTGGLSSITAYTPIYEGMTLRDYFAAKVLQAEVWGWYEGGKASDTVTRYEGIAEHAYMVADAMLKVRAKCQ